MSLNRERNILKKKGVAVIINEKEKQTKEPAK